MSRLAKVLAFDVAVCLLGSCVTDEAPLMTGTTSLQVTLTSPTDHGSADTPLPDNQRQVSFSIRALDENGNPDTSFNATVNIYTQFLGTLTAPPQQLAVVNGVASMNMNIGLSYGPTYLWIEDTTDTSNGRKPTYATGTSPIFWYRLPFLADVSTPDLTDPANWLDHSPLEGKQVSITDSKYGANGKLVVTGVFADGFGLSDVDCTSGTCQEQPFAQIFVYTFGKAVDSNGIVILPGQTLASVSGGVGEFNGFTELNFPQQLVDNAVPDPSVMPPPVVLQAGWLIDPIGMNGEINMEKYESGLMEVDGATVCPLDSDYTTYNQWKLGLGGSCASPINVISAGQVVFDPTQYVGMQLTKVIGLVRSVNIGSFNVWILYPRSTADIQQ